MSDGEMKRHRIALDGGRHIEIEMPSNPTRAEIDAIVAELFAHAQRNEAKGAAPGGHVPVGWRRQYDPKAEEKDS